MSKSDKKIDVFELDKKTDNDMKININIIVCNIKSEFNNLYKEFIDFREVHKNNEKFTNFFFKVLNDIEFLIIDIIYTYVKVIDIKWSRDMVSYVKKIKKLYNNICYIEDSNNAYKYLTKVQSKNNIHLSDLSKIDFHRNVFIVYSKIFTSNTPCV